jgi:hypothetical protein
VRDQESRERKRGGKREVKKGNMWRREGRVGRHEQAKGRRGEEIICMYVKRLKGEAGQKHLRVYGCKWLYKRAQLLKVRKRAIEGGFKAYASKGNVGLALKEGGKTPSGIVTSWNK